MNTNLAAFGSASTTEHQPWTWARDFALLGLVTCTITPLAAQPWLPLHLVGYSTCAGVLGLLSGAVVGSGLRLLLQRFPERSRASVAFVFGPVATGAWGALVASAAALVEQPQYFALSLPCGAIAGALQGLWWVPLSVWLERRDLPRWPVALLSALPAPALGFAGVFGVVFVIDAVV
jgi:hypothetical protein